MIGDRHIGAGIAEDRAADDNIADAVVVDVADLQRRAPVIFLVRADDARRAHASRRRFEINYRRQVRRAEDDVCAADVLAGVRVDLI